LQKGGDVLSNRGRGKPWKEFVAGGRNGKSGKREEEIGSRKMVSCQERTWGGQRRLVRSIQPQTGGPVGGGRGEEETFLMAKRGCKRKQIFDWGAGEKGWKKGKSNEKFNEGGAWKGNGSIRAANEEEEKHI